MLPEQSHIALKEWAVTVQALAQGQQVLLMRKGGIHESSKDFRVIHPEFLLYSTFEHQREDLLKEDNQSALRKLLDQPREDGRITFTHWTKVEETIEVSQKERVDSLSPFHIWTDDYAQSRLRWKQMLPLAVLLLRVYRLEQPINVPFLPEYQGCTSWVEVLERVPLGRLEPVLSDEEFRHRIEEIRGILGAAIPA